MKATSTFLLACGLLALTSIVFPVAVSAAEPCCNIVSVDAKSGLVTMKETKTGQTFRFTLDDPSLVGSIRIGQAVEADFKTMKVTVRPAGATPCCGITAIDRRAGVVTVNDNALKPGAPLHARQVKIAGARLLATLKVGQTVAVDFATNAVTVAPTGSIVK